MAPWQQREQWGNPPNCRLTKNCQNIFSISDNFGLKNVKFKTDKPPFWKKLKNKFESFRAFCCTCLSEFCRKIEAFRPIYIFYPHDAAGNCPFSFSPFPTTTPPGRNVPLSLAHKFSNMWSFSFKSGVFGRRFFFAPSRGFFQHLSDSRKYKVGDNHLPITPWHDATFLAAGSEQLQAPK